MNLKGSLFAGALDDFHISDVGKSSNLRSSSSVSTGCQEMSTLGQGLGLGLPTLKPKEKRGSSKVHQYSDKGSPDLEVNKNVLKDGSLANSLEELAQQTRQTLEGMNVKDEETMADELVENIIKQFEDLGSSEDMQSVMDAMMQQLLSKEVLHEPMKELCEKYPQWLETNKCKFGDEEFNRYSKQYEYMKELCDVYESTPDDFPRIVEVMQNIQACGQPPDELAQEVGPGMDAKREGFPFFLDLLKEGDQSLGENQNCSIM
ncbi:hypothetical protein KP509_07G022700 [Ceratopteris richardii]|uniref:Uncharacterized protein n=1 Tax=Ceratopteris richardii TaxID=49495 RepID=A0A8T2UD40_CERRI|nr:hypothetical protein KP509_07G022700 [Ceratopteris richardii]